MALRRDINAPLHGDKFEPQPLHIPALNPSDPRPWGRGLGKPTRRPDDGKALPDESLPGTSVFEIDIS